MNGPRRILGVFFSTLALTSLILVMTNVCLTQSEDVFAPEELFEIGQALYQGMPKEIESWNDYIHTFLSRGKKEKEKCSKAAHEYMLLQREKHVLVINSMTDMNPSKFGAIYHSLNESLNETLLHPGFCRFHPFWTKNASDLFCGTDEHCQKISKVTADVQGNEKSNDKSSGTPAVVVKELEVTTPPSSVGSIKEKENINVNKNTNTNTTDTNSNSNETDTTQENEVVDITLEYNTTVLENNNVTDFGGHLTSLNSTSISATPTLHLHFALLFTVVYF